MDTKADKFSITCNLVDAKRRLAFLTSHRCGREGKLSNVKYKVKSGK